MLINSNRPKETWYGLFGDQAGGRRCAEPDCSARSRAAPAGQAWVEPGVPVAPARRPDGNQPEQSPKPWGIIDSAVAIKADPVRHEPQTEPDATEISM